MPGSISHTEVFFQQFNALHGDLKYLTELANSIENELPITCDHKELCNLTPTVRRDLIEYYEQLADTKRHEIFHLINSYQNNKDALLEFRNLGKIE